MTNTDCIICDEPITDEFPADELDEEIHELCAMQQESEYDNDDDAGTGHGSYEWHSGN
jgi:hypothetical protein